MKLRPPGRCRCHGPGVPGPVRRRPCCHWHWQCLRLPSTAGTTALPVALVHQSSGAGFFKLPAPGSTSESCQCSAASGNCRPGTPRATPSHWHSESLALAACPGQCQCHSASLSEAASGTSSAFNSEAPSPARRPVTGNRFVSQVNLNHSRLILNFDSLTISESPPSPGPRPDSECCPVASAPPTVLR